MRDTGPLIAAAYIRVSTDEQVKEGFSIPAQSRILEAQAIIKGADDIVKADKYLGENCTR